MNAQARWPRPIPTIGDTSSAAARAADPEGWALPPADREALYRAIEARRDIRRFRPDPVPAPILERILMAAHTAPSVGHSQPWRFVIVSDPATRSRAALLADRARLAQAAHMSPERGRHLLDLDLEGIREAPLGIVVCCDRRAEPEGVLGRATLTDADMWSCACAIENLWLSARAEGLGVGWVTLFKPEELASLVHAPRGVTALGWLCVGWPDERPPSPGLERRGWSKRLELEEVVLNERWPEPGAEGAPPPPQSHLVRAPDQAEMVAAHDSGDAILTAPGSLGALDRAVDRAMAAWGKPSSDVTGLLLLVAADHPVTELGVSAYPKTVTRHVARAAIAGESVSAVAAQSAGLTLVVVDAGIDGPPLDAPARHARPLDPRGDLANTDALTTRDAARLIEAGRVLAEELAGGSCILALGEVGIGNTTAAAALAAALLELPSDQTVGLGAGSDTAIVEAKHRVVVSAVARTCGEHDPVRLLAALGGGEIAFLAGAVLGAAQAHAVVVLDGMVTSVAALVATEIEPAAASYLVAGQRSREPGHAPVLAALGLEPLLDLRIRAGEGAGAALATSLLKAGLAIRLSSARTEG